MFVKEAYLAACGVWGLPPSEFWRMHPSEFWWLYEAKIPPEKRQTQSQKWGKLYSLLGTKEHLRV